MRRTSLNDLVCPANVSGSDAPSLCQSALSLEEDAATGVSVTRAENDPGEVLEAIVRCQSCQETYPIIAGVLILVPDIKTYLAHSYSDILAAAAPCISAHMLSYLAGLGLDLQDVGFQGSIWHNAMGMDLYLSAHYDNLREFVPSGHPLESVINSYAAHDFYARVVGMIEPALQPDARVLDIGCNVGGMAHRMSPHCGYIYAIDYGFRVALTARRVLLQQPSALTDYRLVHDGLRTSKRPLPVEKHDSVEVLVASGLAAPFREASFDLVHCANVADVVPDPRVLITEAARLLSPQGSLFTADPYYWGIDRTPIEKWLGQGVREPAQALRAELEAEWEITSSQDQALWILRVYDRYFTMWIVDCLLAQKRRKQA